MRTLVILVALAIFLSTGSGYAQQASDQQMPVRSVTKVTKPIGRPEVPLTSQEVLLLFSGSKSDERILLTLNNNHTFGLPVTATVYTVSGEAIVLPAFQLTGSESRLVELSPILQAAGLGRQEIGWLKLNYTGVFLGLGAQLTLYSSRDGVGVDSPRSLSADFKSQTRYTAFWIPEGGVARLAFTNSSDGNLFVKLHCGRLSEDFAVPSMRTKVRSLSIVDLSGPYAPPEMPASCDITSDGAISALRVVGTLTSSHGYAAPVRFYDTAGATFSSLTAVGLETSAETHAVVHNVTDDPVTFTPVVSEATLNDPKTVVLEPRVLAPHANMAVSLLRGLRSLNAQGILNATLTLRTDAPKGSIVGGLTQISQPDGLIEDIPLRTGNPGRTAAGAYPLRWDGDYTNLVSLTNTSQKTMTARSLVTVGGITYVLPQRVIEPGRTAVYDVDTMRKNQEKDVNGRVMPLDAAYGKFMWFDASMGGSAGLMGRNSVTSRINHRKSSFSCGMACDFTYRIFPAFSRNPFLYAPYGWGGSITDITYTPYQGYTIPYAFSSTGLSTTSSDILAYAEDPYVSTSYIATVGLSGSVTASYPVTEFVGSLDIFDDCVVDRYDSTPSGGITVGDSTPIVAGIDPSDWPAGTTQQVTFSGQYFGTNAPTLSFSPGTGISYTLLSYNDAEIKANVTVATGTPDEDVSVSVTSHGYGGNGFQSGSGGASPISSSVHATVLSPLNTPEVTVIAWVDPTAPDLVNLSDNGVTSTLVTRLNNAGSSCAFLVGTWAFLQAPDELLTKADRDYAMVWLVKHSANLQLPSTINPASQKKGGNYRLLSDWGNGKSLFEVGITPDPCSFLGGNINNWAAKGKPSQYMGLSGTSNSGRKYKIAEGRIGDVGQRGSKTINGRTVPWIYDIIEFDSSGIPTYSDHGTFPTYYVYKNGQLQTTYAQSPVLDFAYGYDESNETGWSPIP